MEETNKKNPYNAFEILHILNDIYLKHLNEINAGDAANYISDCKERFNNIDEIDNSRKTIMELNGYLIHGQIECLSDLASKEEITYNPISFLMQGLFLITQYGRSFIDLKRQAALLMKEMDANSLALVENFDNIVAKTRRETMDSLAESEKKYEDEIASTKNTFIPQVITLMGIFTAVITLIFKGSEISKTVDYPVLYFSVWDKFLMAIASYMPILIAIIILFLTWYFIFKKGTEKNKS